MFESHNSPLWTRRTWIFLGVITIAAFFTYFHRYWYPQSFFWDENYHIASAQKYLNSIFFMEPHPPIGKLLIAAGEALFGFNENTSQFIGTDYARNPPADFSFVGYRLFPTLLSWLTAPMFFLSFHVLTRRALFATFLSFLYVFDNALIVHARSAMLEGPLLFFFMASILAFLFLWEWKHEAHERKFFITAFIFGAMFAAAVNTKLFGLLLLLLLLPLVWNLRKNRAVLGKLLGLTAAGFALVFCSTWYIHFALGRTVNPSLPDAGFYQASSQYQFAVTSGQTHSPAFFPIMLADSLDFVSHYEKGVPELNLCKQDENGSPFFAWPLGARSINYRWETPDGTLYQYLYLQVNPVVWWISFAAVLLGACLLLVSLLIPGSISLKRQTLLATFLGMYVSFMLVMSQIDRVMYLYHYFMPLLLSFLVLAIVLMELPSIGKLELTEKRKLIGLMVLAGLIFTAYELYKPLTYYEPISQPALEQLDIFTPWDLECVGCTRERYLADPWTA